MALALMLQNGYQFNGCQIQISMSEDLNSPENYEGKPNAKKFPPPFIPVATGIVPNLKRNTH